MTMTFGGLTMADNWTSAEIVAACGQNQQCLTNADGWNTPQAAIRSATAECERKTQQPERDNCFVNLSIFKRLIEGMQPDVSYARQAAAKGTTKANVSRLPQ